MEGDGSFVALRVGGADLRLRPELREWARTALERSGRLRDWAAGHPEAERRDGGRGALHFVPSPMGETRWAVRAFRRGGAVAPLLGDRYLAVGRPRAFREAEVSERARERGVRTPRVVAAAVYPAGPFHRADIVTEVVEKASELAELLFENGRETGAGAAQTRREALAAAGGLIRKMARAGLHHPDLNARNVLLTREAPDDGSEAAQAWVIDLDRARIGAELDPHAMLARLERSLLKIGEGAGRIPGEEELTVLRDAAVGGSR